MARSLNDSPSDAVARDQALWTKWQGGDREAGWRLLESYDVALRHAMHRLGVTDSHEMEEVYQDLVLTLAQYKDAHELQRSFFGLARRMLFGLVVRSRQRSQRVTTSELMEEALAVAERDELPWEEALETCLQGVRKPLERQIFYLRFLCGADISMLAERFRKTPNRVSVVLHSAVKQMRACLLRHGFAP